MQNHFNASQSRFRDDVSPEWDVQSQESQSQNRGLAIQDWNGKKLLQLEGDGHLEFFTGENWEGSVSLEGRRMTGKECEQNCLSREQSLMWFVPSPVEKMQLCFPHILSQWTNSLIPKWPWQLGQLRPSRQRCSAVQWCRKLVPCIFFCQILTVNWRICCI